MRVVPRFAGSFLGGGPRSPKKNYRFQAPPFWISGSRVIFRCDDIGLVGPPQSSENMTGCLGNVDGKAILEKTYLFFQPCQITLRKFQQTPVSHTPGIPFHPQRGEVPGVSGKIRRITRVHYLGVSKNRGTPKWIMDGENNGKNYFLMDDLGGFPLFLVQHPFYRYIIGRPRILG